jgi:hypothetical protein
MIPTSIMICNLRVNISPLKPCGIKEPSPISFGVGYFEG